MSIKLNFHPFGDTIISTGTLDDRALNLPITLEREQNLSDAIPFNGSGTKLMTESLTIPSALNNCSLGRITDIDKIFKFHNVEGIPSKEQAQQAFWGLGDHFWMQIIDGKYHEFGPMVFDKALHGYDREPGFLASVESGCKFASEHLTEKLTILFYKNLHKELCAHFKGEENNTEMSSEQSGVFRQTHCRSKLSIKNLAEKTDNADEKYKIFELCKVELYMEYIRKSTEKEDLRILNAVPDAKKWVENWESTWESKVINLNNYLSKVCSELDVPVFVSFQKINQTIYTNYLCSYPEKHEEILQKLFDRYHQKIDAINIELRCGCVKEQTQQLIEEKIGVIADLFQMLEWLHPFIDGQGRTDLVLQAKLLSEEGSHPAILHEPYMSTYSLFPEWKSGLLSGIESWRAKQLRL